MRNKLNHWTHHGLVLARAATGVGAHVIGDPCIVWDDEIGGWRMFLFADPPGHGQAVCTEPTAIGAGAWHFSGPLTFTNPEVLPEGITHKPFVVMDPYRPNRAARIGGRFCLVTVSWRGGHKLVQQAWAERLAGPWTLQPGVLLEPGEAAAFDAKHIDAVSGYYFPERDSILYFYMGYPAEAQPWPSSAYGSAQAVAVQRIGETVATKGAVILPPATTLNHWAQGWVGGLQLLPGRKHRWIGIVNASPTPPQPEDTSVSREEPPPSLGGFALCDEEWPVQGWRWCPEPITWLDAIPEEARAAGEGWNLWRQHLLLLPDRQWALFYNSGSYGDEQLYLKMADGEQLEDL